MKRTNTSDVTFFIAFYVVNEILNSLEHFFFHLANKKFVFVIFFALLHDFQWFSGLPVASGEVWKEYWHAALCNGDLA